MQKNKEEILMNSFRDLFNKIGWLNKDKMEAALKGYKPSEVHCIEAIKEYSQPNVRYLADTLYMTRGAISKLTKRLQQKGLIENYRNPNNKKEIYFKLTPEGEHVYQIHSELHQEFQERDEKVFETMTNEEFKNMMAFIHRYNQHLDEEIIKQDRRP
ncbi:MarR family transcriptional regulator [Staphylococcus pragensis]|uniref:MarR family transcriptional regulator n=1 Tax=Staphylococcus pragensis TaxID=1611836 RepID=A0A4Z1BNB7_9STAP|nr:MarR family transcriptional regulator [Staphylococcus pragensis]RTX87741.1 MarR family transcriptional regulator [Staphylococcus carnosus]TGN29037.1 MarR family transcriptional regulator [Staphylococcus pragensis]GGG83317.1 MarR family transcriptional regulator [Staphylococcus pragensis]